MWRVLSVRGWSWLSTTLLKSNVCLYPCQSLFWHLLHKLVRYVTRCFSLYLIPFFQYVLWVPNFLTLLSSLCVPEMYCVILKIFEVECVYGNQTDFETNWKTLKVWTFKIKLIQSNRLFFFFLLRLSFFWGRVHFFTIHYKTYFEIKRCQSNEWKL